MKSHLDLKAAFLYFCLTRGQTLILSPISHITGTIRYVLMLIMDTLLILKKIWVSLV